MIFLQFKIEYPVRHYYINVVFQFVLRSPLVKESKLMLPQ